MFSTIQGDSDVFRIKKKLAKNAPSYDFLTWGAYDQIFSQFLKITFNNVVKKFAEFCNFYKFAKKFAIFFAKMQSCL